ncbi:MAG TPA: TadE/TadG family type IV pilus assembly protein [Candidatus Binataceae bacterium]|nr:TadE/TadG family type IV pilus assembly protein [Candidatus Binataceae bacterium]
MRWGRFQEIAARRPTGQTLTEFVLGASVFLLVLFAIIEMAIVVFDYNTISYAARQATRYAAALGPNSPTPATNAQIQQVAIGAAPGVALTNSDVAVSWVTDPNLSTREDAKVTITYPTTVSIPFTTTVVLNLTSTSQMMASQ